MSDFEKHESISTPEEIELRRRTGARKADEAMIDNYIEGKHCSWADAMSALGMLNDPSDYAAYGLKRDDNGYFSLLSPEISVVVRQDPEEEIAKLAEQYIDQAVYCPNEAYRVARNEYNATHHNIEPNSQTKLNHRPIHDNVEQNKDNNKITLSPEEAAIRGIMKINEELRNAGLQELDIEL